MNNFSKDSKQSFLLNNFPSKLILKYFFRSELVAHILIQFDSCFCYNFRVKSVLTHARSTPHAFWLSARRAGELLSFFFFHRSCEAMKAVGAVMAQHERSIYFPGRLLNPSRWSATLTTSKFRKMYKANFDSRFGSDMHKKGWALIVDGFNRTAASIFAESCKISTTLCARALHDDVYITNNYRRSPFIPHD